MWIRSLQNMKGYWANPQATASAFVDRNSSGWGWFRSGDAGYLRDGYLYLHDRIKDMILSGGENHYKHLAIFGPREAAPGAVAGQADTVYHT